MVGVDHAAAVRGMWISSSTRWIVGYFSICRLRCVAARPYLSRCLLVSTEKSSVSCKGTLKVIVTSHGGHKGRGMQTAVVIFSQESCADSPCLVFDSGSPKISSGISRSTFFFLPPSDRLDIRRVLPGKRQ